MSEETETGLITSDGTAEHYFLQAGYKYRNEAALFNDQANADEWQDDVYAMAHDVALKHDFKRIVDIGCGSGFKLMKYFSAYDTTGLELPQYLEELSNRFPGKDWQAIPDETEDSRFPPADLYICSDVIEHIRRPDAFLRRLVRSPFQLLVLSTPAREVLFADGRRAFLEPPANKCHHFEWTMGELHKLIKEYFEIVDHRYTYNGEYTQTVIARHKG